ncbi:MAG: MinD/ParA family protein [Pseudomonadota bacterium]
MHPRQKSPHHQAFPTTNKSPRVICVTSGKGGVGKTNIVVNLAYCLAQKGKKVLVLDADLNLANVDVLLGLTPRYNLHHVFLGEKSLRDIVVKGPGGFSILPASSGILELAELTEEQKLYFLAEMSELGEQTDIVLIDTAAGINKNVIYFTLAAQERIIVLSPEPTSLTDAYALIKVLSTRHDVKKFRILVNSSQSEKEALAVFRQLTVVADRFLSTISLDYLGHIPLDTKLPQAVRSQRLVVEIAPESPSAKKFVKLAAALANEEVPSQHDGNIKFFWQGLFEL